MGRYVPLPQAVAFHESKAPIRIIVGGNRSGCTYAAREEFLRLLPKAISPLIVGTYERALQWLLRDMHYEGGAISSESELKDHGFDLAWIDGEVANVGLLSDLLWPHPNRKVIWSLGSESTPVGWIRPLVVDVFNFSIDGNTHLKPEAVAKFKERIADSPDFLRRTQGVM